MTLIRYAVVFVLVWSLAATASAQGVQTGVLRGTVADGQDLPIPGVTVTLSVIAATLSDTLSDVDCPSDTLASRRSEEKP